MAEQHTIETRRRCPACDFQGATDVGRKNSFRVLQCAKCRTLYTSTLPAPGDALDYDDYYTSDSLTVPEFLDRRFREIVAEFAHYRLTNRFLDVGFGAGSFLLAARDLGWDVRGVEPSRTAFDHARRLGFDVFNGEIADAMYPDQFFDVVIAVEMLEHLPSPRSLIKQVARVLRPGGLFWATTPHARGISSRLLGVNWSVVSPPEHLQLFSLKGIKLMFEDAGFRRVQLRTEGINPAEIIYGLKSRPAGDEAQATGPQPFDRVRSAHELNAKMMRSPLHRLAKRTANGMLNLSNMGDSLKITATF